MTIWTLSLADMAKVFGTPLQSTCVQEEDLNIEKNIFSENREVWRFFHRNVLIGGLAFYHDDYLTYIHSIHVIETERQKGWSKKMYAILAHHYGPLVHSDDRTAMGRLYIKDEH